MKLEKIVGARVSKDVMEKLDFIAKKERRRRSDLIRIIIEDYIAKYFPEYEPSETVVNEKIETENTKNLKHKPV